MKNGKMLRVIPLLLFTPLVITSITSCGETRINNNEIKFTNNQNQVKNGSYKINFLDESGKLIDEPKLNSTLKLIDIQADDGYELNSIIVKFNNNLIDITVSKEFKFVEYGEFYLQVLFTKVNDPVVPPEVKLSQLLLDSTVEHGTLSFKEHNNEDRVKNNTTVEVIALAEEGYKLESLTANGVSIIETKTFITDENVTSYFVSATFIKSDVEIKKSTISIDQSIVHGTVKFKGYENNSKVEDKTTIELIIEPEENYVLETLTLNGTSILDEKKFVTNSEVELYLVNATFKQTPLPQIKKSEIAIDTKIENGTVEFVGHNSGDKVTNNTKITVKVTPNSGYELFSLTVNNEDIKDSLEFITDENVARYLVKATFKIKDIAPDIPQDNSYLVQFKNFEKGNKIENFNDNYFDTADVISSIIGNNVYALKDENYVMVGTSNGAGSLTFNLNKEITITKIVLHTKIHDPNKKIIVSLDDNYKDDSHIAINGDVTINFNSIKASKIVVSNKSKKERFHINGISIYTDATNIEPPTPIEETSIVSYEANENGTISFASLENNSKVKVGTKVKVNVEPKKDYKLKTLTVNDIDILSKKEFVVSEANITYLVKATFEKNSEVDPNPETPEDLFTKYDCITIKEALKICDSVGDVGTTQKYNIYGVVENFTSTKYGNLCIRQGNDTLYVRNLVGYTSMTNKPDVGDEVVLNGILKKYQNKTSQIFEPTLVELRKKDSSINPEPDKPVEPTDKEATVSLTTQNKPSELKATVSKIKGIAGEQVTVNFTENETCYVKEIRINDEVYYGDRTGGEFKVTLKAGLNTILIVYQNKNDDKPSSPHSDYFVSAEVENMGTRGTLGSVDDYYAECRGLKGVALKNKLHEIINKDKKTIGYGNLMKVYQDADLDVDDPSYMLLCYTKEKVKASTLPNFSGQVNREHTWPKSQGEFKDKPAGCDAHMVRPCDKDLNSKRGHIDFGEGGGEVMQGCHIGLTFEPMDFTKGDTARTIFYMAVCYSDLELKRPSDNRYEFFGDMPNNGNLGSFDVLYKWATDTSIDPIDKFEMNRNNIVDEKHQHNRNPFVDHPEFIEMIYDKNYTGPGALINK